MPKSIQLLQGEPLFRWHGSKPPLVLNDGTSPEGGSIEVPDDFRGYALRQEFARGRMPIDQFVRTDKRFIEPIGFTPDELTRSSELGYFRIGADEAPRKLTTLAQEMAVRAVGARVLSPRDGDRIEEWDYTEGGIPGRLVVMFKNGILMSEDRGRGDARPQLMCSADECLRAGELRTTNKTREEGLSRGTLVSQGGLFGGIRPAPQPSTPDDEMRNFLLGR